MMRLPLYRTDSKELLIENLEVADSFSTRLIGLMGREKMGNGAGLWIKRCNSIHTFFMKFSIDCVFVDRDLKIKTIIKNIPPWRMTRIVFGASSVIELPAGTCDSLKLHEGEKLYVGS
jgi:uncharacterized protein